MIWMTIFRFDVMHGQLYDLVLIHDRFGVESNKAFAVSSNIEKRLKRLFLILIMLLAFTGGAYAQSTSTQQLKPNWKRSKE